jgi:hypothetical protein
MSGLQKKYWGKSTKDDPVETSKRAPFLQRSISLLRREKRTIRSPQKTKKDATGTGR